MESFHWVTGTLTMVLANRIESERDTEGESVDALIQDNSETHGTCFH
jgi:hypothetical protein